LNARNQFSGLEGWVAEVLTVGFDRVATLLPLRDTDVVVKVSENVIPEVGHHGYAPEAGLIHITIDPNHKYFRENADSSLNRTLAHELHHSARWDGPGYGDTLGEALVTEGLAGHFTQEAFGGQPEPWENLPVTDLHPNLTRAQQEWDSATYDHEAWFFGYSDLPRWLGYSLGYQMVSRYLAKHHRECASGLVHQDSQIFRPFLAKI
jgi:uncharacterized protein YjaZ